MASKKISPWHSEKSDCADFSKHNLCKNEENFDNRYSKDTYNRSNAQEAQRRINAYILLTSRQKYTF